MTESNSIQVAPCSADVERKKLARIKKNARTSARYFENKEEIASYKRRLVALKKSQDPSYLKKQAERMAAYRAANPDRDKQVAKRSRDKNIEARKASTRAWFAANPDKRAEYQQGRRAKVSAAGGKLTPGIKAKLFILQAGCCACCKTKCSIRGLHMDHVMPLALGGGSFDDNMQLLCQPCNNSKYSKHPIDFMQSRGFLL